MSERGINGSIPSDGSWLSVPYGDSPDSGPTSDTALALTVALGGGGGVSDGDKGDITVTVSGSQWEIDANAVGDAELRDSAGVSVIGRAANSSGDPADIVAGADGQVLQRASGALVFGSVPGLVTPRRVVGVTFDGNGSTPTVGSIGYAVVPFNGTIDQWHIVADASGSAVVDVWKAAGAIPTDANRIAGTEKPTLAAAQLGSDTSLTTWSTTAVTAGDVFGFELESVTTCTRITVEVRVTES